MRPQLSVPAYHLGNLWRRLGLPHRSGRLVKHARYYGLLLAQGHLNRRLCGDVLHRIWALPLPSG